MNAKKWVISLLTILLLFPALYVPTYAAEQPTFLYELTVDGKDTVEVTTGDIITVTLYLYRTDADASYTMHAMQDEIRYDSTFFELVEDSVILPDNVSSTDIDAGGGMREFYMNYVSFAGGTRWRAKERVGSFQLRVIGTSGVSTITNEDISVSLPDGSGSYMCEANELTVILSCDCTIKYETNGGNKMEPTTAIYGEKLEKPADPVREGKYFVGWYKDIDLTKPWDFANDVVKGNMTLYAKWADNEPGTTNPGTTEPGTTESGTTRPETQPGPDTQPGVPTQPEPDDDQCPICGNRSDGMFCLRCKLIIYFLLILIIVLILSMSVLLYYQLAKKKKNEEQDESDSLE